MKGAKKKDIYSNIDEICSYYLFHRNNKFR